MNDSGTITAAGLEFLEKLLMHTSAENLKTKYSYRS